MSIIAGGNYNCVLLQDGTVQCWGWNLNGELGNGVVDNPLTVSQVLNVANAVEITRQAARINDGTVMTWGSYRGVDGVNRADPTTTIAGIDTAVSLSKAYSHGCAALADATVQCWGQNTDGRVGDGTTETRTLPTTVLNVDNAVTVGMGRYWHSCAILSTGRIKCWGQNDYGQLGNGEAPYFVTPQDISGL